MLHPEDCRKLNEEDFFVMAKKKVKETKAQRSSVISEKLKRHKAMAHLVRSNLERNNNNYLFGAAVTLVVAVCVVPLTAEVSTRK